VQGRLAYVLGPRRTTREHLADAWTRLVEAAGGDEDLAGRPLEERRLAGRVAAMRATACVDRGAGDDAIRWGRRALEPAPTEAALASTGHMLAGAYALTGQLEDGEALLDELCTRVDELPPATVSGALEADVRCGRGLLRLWCHDLDGAAEDLERSLGAAASGGSFAARESARFYLAEVRYRQGRWDEAILLAQLSASVVDDADQAWMAALPHATAARPLAARGEEAAEDHLARALAAAEAVGLGVGVGLARIAALEVAACRRDHATVVELGDLLVGQQRGPVDERIAPWRATYVEALVGLDRATDAARVVEQLQAVAPTDLLANDRARAEVALAVAARDEDAVDAAAAVGLALDPDAVGPYPRARLELALGRAWRRRGDRRRAQAVLEIAHTRLSGLRAIPWLEQVERELAASGLRPARRTARTGAELTPQEQAVAQLVARGLTNREVGAELVVSAKTVEHHLSRIYAKLGLRSRTELARTLQQPGG
jgi:DNA-binding CsgD family transcriptional regulator